MIFDENTRLLPAKCRVILLLLAGNSDIMKKVIGREKQVKQLNDLLQSSKSELVAMYGRRRVGKTFLIRETFRNQTIFEVSGIPDGNYKDQLANFFNEICKRKATLKKRKVPKNWLEAFGLLEEFIDTSKSTDKKVIFIDEFPWMHTHKSKFVQFFAHFWNSYCTKRDDLVVVVCGSAASFMINKVINDKKGLHNRITLPMKLLPFDLYETELFLKSKKVNLDRYACLQLYMAIGGIPHYLEKIHPGDSVATAIDRLCFEKDGLLFGEFNQIFASLFENSENHRKVVEALAKSQNGITRAQLVEKTHINSGGTLTKTISELIESGFVTEYQPYKNVTKETLFRLTDEYSIFYLKFILNKKGGSWKTLYTSKSYTAWGGFAFENICLKHEKQILSALGIFGINAICSSWRNEHAQIDMLIDRSDRTINICELKFSEKEFVINKNYAANILNKKQEFIRHMTDRKNIVLTLITTFGVHPNEHSAQVMDNQITMNCLFEKIL
jgi:AAA+ ATPase superfamily predicted ATPase